MEIISREILRLDRVVRTFLDFTRPVELQLDNVPMQDLVREIVDLARPQTAAAKIQMTVHEEADGVEVRVDRDLLKQAMLNVVVNAMQAMPAGRRTAFRGFRQRRDGGAANLRHRRGDSGRTARKDLPSLLHARRGRVPESAWR